MQHSLANLTPLVQEISDAENAVAAMQTIVARLSDLMEVPVCSLYLKSPSRAQLILAATQGLSQSAVGKIRLNPEEGLVGTVAATKNLLNLEDASLHEKFRLFPDAEETPYRQFMAVPLIHLRQLVGVIVIQGTKRAPFSPEAEAFLVTVASQLAATLNAIQKSGDWMPRRRPGKLYKRYDGISGSTGVAVGQLTQLNSQVDLKASLPKKADDIQEELERFHHALEGAIAEVEQGEARIEKDLPEDIASLFTVYRMMLASPELSANVITLIEKGNTAIWSVRKAALDHAAVFEASEDPYMQARAEDVRNIAIKLINQMLRKKRLREPPKDTAIILAGDLISITDLSDFDKDQIVGIICRSGSALSHTAIVANALGIPAVMGVTELDIERYSGQTVIIDGNSGFVIASPPKEMTREYRQIKRNEEKFNSQLAQLKDLPAETDDGFHVTLLTNTGLLADVSPGLVNGAEGVGLYRSEIPFMVHDGFPTEDEQYRVYKQVIDAYYPRPVSMRTLDIGGDKQLPYYEIKEENPYLGWRGIRFTLDNTALQITQLRAMVRAGHGRENLQIIVPMVSRIDEIKALRALLDQVLKDLHNEGKQATAPKLGIMIEVPAAILLLEKAAPYIDFVSVGTNDLAQYLLAVDRNNPKVSRLFDPLHPAVLSALEMIQARCKTLNLPISLCGEMAADPAAVLLLIAMGFDRLSLSAHRIPMIKWVIRNTSRKDLEKLLIKAQKAEDESEIRRMTKRKLKTLGL
ncbi:phosphoenolpyruvate--protein phosphotransferase [Neptunomonas sp. XY-337]|uniref:phosphoenolpyruvate--protein phosphotransferase n=1 Tax=Neptunomonas sp. XY-337 TaxID=2561897 RepID=UPI0010AB3BFD|nr:phosphoenolpyruvate--protein phosphotransferase [Neptunomonas sp. XY-337]